MADKKKEEAFKLAIMKQKPDAFFRRLNKDNMNYYTVIDRVEVNGATFIYQPVNFVIPISEIGGAEFNSVMKAHTLIRYMQLPD